MRSAIIAFLIGILACYNLNTLPAINWVVLILPILYLIWKIPVLRLPLFMLLGFLWFLFYAQLTLLNTFPNELESKNITVIGKIINLPRKTDYGWNFDFSIKSTYYQNKIWQFRGNLRLNWYGQAPYMLYPQQEWQLTVRLKKPHSLVNFEGFDYTKWLFQHDFKAIGYVRAKEKQILLKQAGVSIDGIRYRLMNGLEQILKDHQRGIITALAIGEKGYISQAQRTILQRTGTAHLAVISGLHVGLFVLFIFYLLKKLWRYIHHKVNLHEHQFIALIAIIATLLYALLAGFSLPTQRAFIMITIALLMPLLARQIAFSHSLFLALFIVLIINPLSVMNVGFWLSFWAVFIILYSVSNQSNTNHFINLFKIQIIITLGLAPIVLSTFGYLSLISLLANIIAIPFIGFITIPLTLIGTLLLLVSSTIASLFLQTAAYLLDILWLYLTWLSTIDWALWHSVIPSTHATLLAMLGIIILLLPKGFPAKWLGSICFLPLFFPLLSSPNKGEVWFTLLDVGQGLSAVIQTQHHTLVYDTGVKSRYSDFNMGDAVVLPFLRNRGISRIDTLLLSHDDNDHTGGAPSILANLPVNSILSSSPKHFINKHINQCVAGQTWHWDGVRFKILHPHTNYNSRSDNDSSCVLQVYVGDKAILLTGDIEKHAEYSLIYRYGNSLKSNILIVPHHGSGTSSTNQFIDKVQPEIALFAVGYKNPYRHPKLEIVERYKQRNIQILDSVDAGAISIQLSPDKLSIPRLARDEKKGFWYAQ